MLLKLATALLLGLVSATTLVGESGTFDLTGTSAIADYISVDGEWKYDIVVQSIFDAGVDEAAFYKNYYSYELNTKAYAYGEATISFFGGAFYWNPQVTFKLWDISPFKQYVKYVNPLELVMDDSTSQDSFDIEARAGYRLKFLEVQYSADQDLVVFKKSILGYVKGLLDGSKTWDYILPDAAADWTLEGPSSYDSEYLHWSPADLIDSNGDWYGSHSGAYYSLSLSQLFA
jgi:hypothetical protein